MDAMPRFADSAENHILRLQKLYEGYGYGKFRMSKLEDYNLYRKHKNFLKDGSIITFSGPDGRLLALKQDITLSILKNVRDDALPCKVFYAENVYRVSHDAGDIREIPQAGVEFIGSVDVYTMSEVMLLASESLAAVSENYILGVSHMGLVRGLLDAAELPSERRAEILACIQNKSVHTLRDVCAHACIPDALAEKLCTLASLFGTVEDCLATLDTLVINLQTANAVQELRQVYALLCETGHGEKLRIDFSVAGNMQYYNGIAFQGFLDGTPQSVLSGGRYDDLARQFDKDCGAIGFAVYLDRLCYDASDAVHNDAVLVLYDPADVHGLSAAVAQLRQMGCTVQTLPAAKENERYSVVYRYSEGRLMHI